MKILVNEKQFDLIVSSHQTEEEIKEIDTPVSDTASNSTSTASSSTSSAPYPAVGKWESGVTRGSGNQIGVTKWSDIVGATLVRGKANPLKEQDGEVDVNKSQILPNFKSILTPAGYAIHIPEDSTITSLADKNDLNPMTYKSLVGWLSKKRGGSGNAYTDPWIPITLEKVIKLGSVMGFEVDGKSYKAKLTNPKLDAIIGMNMNIFHGLEPDPVAWKFNGYYDNNNTPYKPPVPPKISFWDEWGGIVIQIGVTLLITVVSMGVGTILQMSAAAVWAMEAIGQAGFNLIIGINDIRQGNDFGATLSFIFAALPFAGKYWRIGMADVGQAKNLAKKIGVTKLESAEQLAQKISAAQLTKEENILMKKILNITPEDFKKGTHAFMNEVKNKLAEQGKDIKKIKVPILKKHITKDLGFQTSVMGGATVGYGGYKYIKTKEDINKINNAMKREKNYTAEDMKDINSQESW